MRATLAIVVFGLLAANVEADTPTRQEILRVAVPVARAGTIPEPTGRVFGEVTQAVRQIDVRPETGLQTVVFLDGQETNYADMVCSWAEWLSVPELHAHGVLVFTSGTSVLVGQQLISAPGQDFQVVADPAKARTDVEALCKRSLANRKFKDWSAVRYSGRVPDARTAFWKWLQTQPPSRVFWIARRFPWMETPTAWETVETTDPNGWTTSSSYYASTGDQSEWNHLKRLPGLSHHMVIPVIPMGAGYRFPAGRKPPAHPETHSEGERRSFPEAGLPGAQSQSPVPVVPASKPPEPVGSFRREWKHALQFAGWFGGSVYGPRKQIGEALRQAFHATQQFRVMEFSVPCPMTGKAVFGPIGVVGTADNAGEWRRGAACGGTKEPWPDSAISPAQLVLNHGDIEPCVSCVPQREMGWRFALRLPERLSTEDVWDVFIFDAAREKDWDWMTRRSSWRVTRVWAGLYLPIDVDRGKVRRHMVVLIRRQGTRDVSAAVLDLQPISPGADSHDKQ